jgi:hypothetical protein
MNVFFAKIMVSGKAWTWHYSYEPVRSDILATLCLDPTTRNLPMAMLTRWAESAEISYAKLWTPSDFERTEHAEASDQETTTPTTTPPHEPEAEGDTSGT